MMALLVRWITRIGNRVAFWATAAWDRLGPGGSRRDPARFGIDLHELHRMDGHWALTFARLGTVYLPRHRLAALGAKLDLSSYLRVLRQARRRIGPASTIVRKHDEPAPLGEKTIRIHFDYYSHADQHALWYPYVMHPWLYATGFDRRVATYRSQPRRFRLFFSGATNETYAGSLPYPMMSRQAILECLIETFRADAFVAESRADLARLSRTDRPIVVILFRGQVVASAAHHYLPRERYIRLLASSAFALCPPGVCMPHSHNLIEAMAVGTIPVTNYAEYCRPPLVDGRTCLTFATPDEFRRIVRSLLTAPAALIHEMRGAVAHDYDQHLSPTGFAERLGGWLAQAQSKPSLILNREATSTNLWEAARHQQNK